MVLPLWGQLDKSQDDDQKIVDAIAQAIAEHEADPEAHLGEGESLSEHKHESILDHPAGSILPDKWSFNDLDFDTSFESLDGFIISSGVTNISWPGATFDIFDGGGDLRTLKANLLGLLVGGSLTYDYLCDVYFSIDSATQSEIIDIGISNNAMTTRMLGFRITDGDLYGVARWDGNEELTTNLGNVSTGDVQFVRVFYDSGDEVIYFYLNGVQVATLQPSEPPEISNQWSVYAQDNGEESSVLRIYKAYISRSL